MSQILKSSILCAVLALGGVAAAVSLPIPAALAQSAQDKAAVDAAKARGEVGEQADGYLGFVRGAPSDPSVGAAVAAINAGRRQAFAEAAARTGVSPDAAGAAAAQQLIGRTPPGQYYRDAGGAWVRR
jgi:uncharacterized protein YdbL (DUF1318 family)